MFTKFRALGVALGTFLAAHVTVSAQQPDPYWVLVGSIDEVAGATFPGFWSANGAQLTVSPIPDNDSPFSSPGFPTSLSLVAFPSGPNTIHPDLVLVVSPRGIAEGFLLVDEIAPDTDKGGVTVVNSKRLRVKGRGRSVQQYRSVVDNLETYRSTTGIVKVSWTQSWSQQVSLSGRGPDGPRDLSPQALLSDRVGNEFATVIANTPQGSARDNFRFVGNSANGTSGEWTYNNATDQYTTSGMERPRRANGPRQFQPVGNLILRNNGTIHRARAGLEMRWLDYAHIDMWYNDRNYRALRTPSGSHAALTGASVDRYDPVTDVYTELPGTNARGQVRVTAARTRGSRLVPGRLTTNHTNVADRGVVYRAQNSALVFDNETQLNSALAADDYKPANFFDIWYADLAWLLDVTSTPQGSVRGQAQFRGRLDVPVPPPSPAPAAE
jgi:hypothetical protein